MAESAAASSFVAAPEGHHPATAKSVIFLFMEGGPSQLDTFDRKPLLNQLAGKPLPSSFREPMTAMGATRFGFAVSPAGTGATSKP